MHFDHEPPITIDRTIRYDAVIDTGLGTMTVALDPFSALHAVNNFVFLARAGFYDGLTFHRIIKGFMCQAGCPTGDGTGGPGYTFSDELPKPGRYELGSIAMANAGPNTNGSQFFITLAPTPWLDNKHAIFGEVSEGIEIVRAIGKVKTGAQDRPAKEIVVKSVTIEKS